MCPFLKAMPVWGFILFFCNLSLVKVRLKEIFNDAMSGKKIKFVENEDN